MASDTSPVSPRSDQSFLSDYNPNTYLSHCAETIYDAESIAKKEERDALAYKVGAYALATFFAIADLTALVFTFIYLPIFLPMLGVCSALIYKNKVRGWTNQLSTDAASHKLTAKRVRAIAEEYNKLGNEDNFLETQNRIVELVPSLQGRCANLIPLLAHFNYYERIQSKYAQKTADKVVEAQKKPSTELCREVSRLRQTALIAKTTQAFILAVMQKREFEGGPQDIYTLKDFKIPADLSDERKPWVRNAIYGMCSRSAPAVVFKQKDISPITFDELLAFTTQDLSARFLALI